jgi:predicted dehydrogenase
MADAPLRVAVFGAGFGAYCLTPAFQCDPRTEVAVLCSPSAERRNAAVRKYGIEFGCATIDEAFDRGLFDIAAIAVPPSAQGDIAIQCLARGIPVMAEKPLAADLADAEELAEAAERSGVPTAIDFLFPEIAAWREAKHRLDAGEIGRIRHVVVTWMMESHDVRNRLSGWKTDGTAGGGVMSHFGSHTLYYLEWLCGPIARVRAQLDTTVGLDVPGDTMANLALQFESGASAAVCLCSAATAGTGHRIELYGEDGMLALANEPPDHVAFRLYMATRDAPSPRTIVPSESDREVREGEDPRVVPIANLVHRFVDAIQVGKHFAPGFREGLRVQRFLNEISNPDAVV